MNRREVLASAGVIIASPFTGCLSVFQPEIELGGVFAANYADRSKTLNVEIRDEGSVVHSETLELDKGTDADPDRASAECGWSNPGSFVVEGSLTDLEMRNSADLTDRDNGCYYVSFGFDGALNNPIAVYVEACEEVDLLEELTPCRTD